MLTQQLIESALVSFKDPYLGQDYIALKILKKIEIMADAINITLALPYPTNSYPSLPEAIILHLTTILGAKNLDAKKIIINIKTKINAHKVQNKVPLNKNIKNIIAIASGKGGVGKSTVSNHLAIALAQAGASVGLLDADIYGPSQPWMLGVATKKTQANDQQRLVPITIHGIQSMSIGYLVEQDTPMIWRGPMVSGALQQLLNETLWDMLDYLIIDLPPGTGDIQLTMTQKIPLTCAVIVTTPQDIALIDARKAYGMFRKLNIPVLGVIENMAYYHCPQCGHNDAIFGEHGASRMARQYDIPLLGRIPLSATLRECMDNGVALSISEPEHSISQEYAHIARQISANIALLDKDYGNLFSKIIVQ
jgi:ATP-binding protein involved in chromosome partitioning